MRQGGKDEHIRKPNLRDDKMADPEVPIDYKIKMLMADNQRKFEVGDFVGSFYLIFIRFMTSSYDSYWVTSGLTSGMKKRQKSVSYSRNGGD